MEEEEVEEEEVEKEERMVKGKVSSEERETE